MTSPEWPVRGCRPGSTGSLAVPLPKGSGAGSDVVIPTSSLGRSTRARPSYQASRRPSGSGPFGLLSVLPRRCLPSLGHRSRASSGPASHEPAFGLRHGLEFVECCERHPAVPSFDGRGRRHSHHPAVPRAARTQGSVEERDPARLVVWPIVGLDAWHRLEAAVLVELARRDRLVRWIRILGVQGRGIALPDGLVKRWSGSVRAEATRSRPGFRVYAVRGVAPTARLTSRRTPQTLSCDPEMTDSPPGQPTPTSSIADERQPNHD